MTMTEIAGPLGAVSLVILGGLAPFVAAPLATALLGAPVAGVMRALIALAEDVAAALGRFAQLCLLVLALGMLSGVILRYVFGESLTKLSEVVMYAHALGFLMAAPAALIGNTHVRVDIFYEGLSARGRAAVDVAGFTLFLAPTMVLLLIYCGPVVELAWRIGERSPETDGLPLVFLLKTAMPVFAVAMLAAGVAHAGRAALRLRGLADGEAAAVGDEPQATARAGAVL
ncbi:MAG: TRAP transporter small permease subunit [Caulobacter sp.]|nr:TRAP transporter small permease subunit [Caulobacter sp.]